MFSLVTLVVHAYQCVRISTSYRILFVTCNFTVGKKHAPFGISITNEKLVREAFHNTRAMEPQE